MQGRRNSIANALELRLSCINSSVCNNSSCTDAYLWNDIIAHVYRLSAVHCQVTRYSHRVPGYLPGTLCQPIKDLLTKYQPIDYQSIVSLNSCQASKKIILHPLGDFNRLFEGLPGTLFKTWLWNITMFLKLYQSDPKNKFSSLHCW